MLNVKTVFILLVFFLIALFFYNRFILIKRPTVKIGETTFRVEVVKTVEEKAKGLAGHKPLNDNKGMLFEFPSGDGYGFWMKGMTFSIDIIWIKNKKIIYFVENVFPPLPGQSDDKLTIYTPPEPAEYVLEIKAGETKKNKIKINDRFAFSQI